MRHFPVKSGRLLCFRASPGASRRCRAASKEVSGGQGKLTASERWPESSGRGLDDEFQVEAFSVKSGRCLCVFWGVQVDPGGVELRPRRSQEFRGSLEFQNGGLRALEELG